MCMAILTCTSRDHILVYVTAIQAGVVNTHTTVQQRLLAVDYVSHELCIILPIKLRELMAIDT